MSGRAGFFTGIVQLRPQLHDAFEDSPGVKQNGSEILRIKPQMLFPRPETEVARQYLLRYSVEREEKTMARKQLVDKLSIYIPQSKIEEKR